MSADDFTLFLSPTRDGLSREDLLLDAAAHFTGVKTFRWECVRTADGKPYFPAAPEICFSISHSGGYWACAFGLSPVGFDLQRHEQCRAEAIARRFFHPEEIAWLEARGYCNENFFSIWTAKESYLKYTGEGIVNGLDWFSVLAPLPGGAELRHLSGLDGYSLCLCAAKVGAVTKVLL